MNVAHSSSGHGATHGKNAAGGKKRTGKYFKGKKGKRQFKDQNELMDYIVSIIAYKDLEPVYKGSE